MAVALPVPTQNENIRSAAVDRSPSSSRHLGFLSPFSSSAVNMTPQYGNSCALTILKGDPNHPINPHAPIHKKPDSTSGFASSSPSPRFAASFSNLRSASQAASSGFDSSVNVHAVSDHGILLPFLHRPSEVKELLFDTKANESLMYRLCSVFGGDPNHPTHRGNDERWDEMLELLIELDRPLLDDEDWLARLESLVMERSPSLWAQLARCLGAEGLTYRPAVQPGSSRFDSWALPSRCVGVGPDNDSPLSTPSDATTDDGNDDDEHIDRSLSVNVEPLQALPQSYSEQPAAKLQKSSLYEPISPATESSLLPPEPAAEHASSTTSGPASPAEMFAMSASADDSAMTSSLEDIMEEPHSSAQAGGSAASRRRSHSGKFAGLRISALTSSTASPASRRTSNSSSDASGSPLPTGTMSPAGLAPPSPDAAPSRETSTSFAKHRRLSVLMVHNHPTQQHQPQGHKPSTLDLDKELSPMSASPRRQRGISEASQSLQGHTTFHSHPRRRAQSFARSFAELTSPAAHIEQLRADHAKAEADRLAEGARRISLQDTHNTAAASAPAVPSGGLGLHPHATASDTLDATSGKARRASTGRKRVGSVGTRGAGSSPGSSSPPIPGLLPDGRTRHPSGSCGSRDLSESIAAFRNTMGLSISPSPSERGYCEFGDGKSDAGKSTDSATRKRKGSGGAELPKPTSRTADTVETKVSRKSSPPAITKEHQAQFEKPKHMQELETRSQGNASSGSGLALGGGFSLAKSGANFRRQSHDSMSSSSQSGWRSSFSRRDGTRTRGVEHFSLRSPPAVHRRPGGFVSLAQEYERARQGRRSSEVAFSINSNAVESSPSSSIASFDIGGGHSRRQSSEDSMPRLELPLSRDEKEATGGSTKAKQAATPGIVKGDPTPKAGPGGGITPRASFGASSTRSQGYPFPNLLNRMTTAAAAAESGATEDNNKEVTTPGRGRGHGSLGPATPLSPLQACRTRLSPSPSASVSSAQHSPRSPSIVFPISPNPSISRAQEFKKALDTRQCQAAISRIEDICGASTSTWIRELLTSTERSHMHDEHLLEEVGRRIGLVDHEHARQLGGEQAEHADVVLAEEGYEDKWEAFAALCRSLGVGQYELGMAKRRCGPAIDTCR